MNGTSTCPDCGVVKAGNYLPTSCPKCGKKCVVVWDDNTYIPHPLFTSVMKYCIVAIIAVLLMKVLDFIQTEFPPGPPPSQAVIDETYRDNESYRRMQARQLIAAARVLECFIDGTEVMVNSGVDEPARTNVNEVLKAYRELGEAELRQPEKK